MAAPPKRKNDGSCLPPLIKRRQGLSSAAVLTVTPSLSRSRASLLAATLCWPPASLFSSNDRHPADSEVHPDHSLRRRGALEGQIANHPLLQRTSNQLFGSSAILRTSFPRVWWVAACRCAEIASLNGRTSVTIGLIFPASISCAISVRSSASG